MLTLTRDQGDTIQIGRDVVVVVKEFRWNGRRPQVRIGVIAPQSIRVTRGELIDVDFAHHEPIGVATQGPRVGDGVEAAPGVPGGEPAAHVAGAAGE